MGGFFVCLFHNALFKLFFLPKGLLLIYCFSDFCDSMGFLCVQMLSLCLYVSLMLWVGGDSFLFIGLFCPFFRFVCIFILFNYPYLLLFLDACSFSNGRESKGVDLGG